jgi:alkylation response protein AidB-like acyl-CoA dehydrogenase
VKAFGKRLDELQTLQLRLADMATELEAARTFVWRGGGARSQGFRCDHTLLPKAMANL